MPNSIGTQYLIALSPFYRLNEYYTTSRSGYTEVQPCPRVRGFRPPRRIPAASAVIVLVVVLVLGVVLVLAPARPLSYFCT